MYKRFVIQQHSLTTVVHIASGDLWAGAEVQLYHLAKELHKNKLIRLWIILLNHGILENELKKAGISVTVFDEKQLGTFQIFMRLHSFLKELSPDIIHTHRQKENVLGGFAALLLRRARSLRTVHGARESKPPRMQINKQFFLFMDWLSGRLLHDKIVAVSSQLADQLATQFPASKIRVAENGIDLEEIQKAAALQVDLPGPSNTIKIAIVGRLVAVKRTDIFLRAAQIITKESEKNYAFYIFGDGPLRDDIASLSKTLGIEDRVFMMGFQSNIAAYLSRMDFLLITSNHEGLPMNLLEALGLRIPVIAHAVGGIPEVLDYGKCGVLVSENKPEKYAAAIQHCLSNTDQLAVMVENGYQQLVSRYTANHTASIYCQLYFEMLAQGNPGIRR